MENINNQNSIISSLISICNKFINKGYTGIELIRALYFSKENAIPNTDETYIEVLHNTLSSEEINILNDHFKEIFKYFYSYTNSTTFDIENNELVSCVTELVNAEEGSRILIPYGGLNFAIHNPNHKYTIISKSTWTNNNIRIAQNIFKLDIEIIDSDIESIVSDTNVNNLYDHILAFPSWVIDYPKNIQNELITSLMLLKEHGSMFLFLKEAICTDPNWVNFRESLIKKDNYPFSVINIPTPYYHPFGLDGGCIFLIEKKAYENFSYLADFSKGKHSRSARISLMEMLVAFKTKDPQFFWKLHPYDIINDFDLNPRHYPINDETRLSELVDNLLYKFKDPKYLITSIAAHVPNIDSKLIMELNPEKLNVGTDITRDNLNFLVKNLNKIIQDYYFDSEEDIPSFLKATSILFNRLESPGYRILLPYGKLGLAAFISDISDITVQESNILDHLHSRLINCITGSNATINLDNQKSGFNPDLEKENFDRIISFCERFKHKANGFIDTTIANLTEDLAYGGAMSIILPKEACYSEEWLPIREFLVKNCHNFRSTIISAFTDKVLFFIQKRMAWDDWSKYDKIKLVDASVETLKQFDYRRSTVHINVDSLIQAIENNSTDVVYLLSTNNLDAGYNFIASRYSRFEHIPEYDATKQQLIRLGDIITLIPRHTSIQKDCRAIDVAHLSTNYLSSNIDINDLRITLKLRPELTSANGGYFCIEHGQILVGKIEGLSDDYKIAIYDNIIHFEINPDITSLDYILKVLSSTDYVLKQAECLTKGYDLWGNEGERYRESILDTFIILPSLEEQKEILITDIQKGYTDKTKELEKAFNEFKEDMHLKKHAIGQTIFSINNWMTLLKLARKRGEGIVKDSDVIGKAHPHSVYEIYENLEATLKRLQIQISKMDTGYEMLPIQIGITSFISDFINRHPRSEFEYINLVDWCAKDDIPVVNIDEDNNITGISSTDFVLRKGDDLHMIYFPTEALELIFENIISNACSHGFSEAERAYKIRITGEINGKDISIYVSNNGNPIHKDFSANDVFKYAKSTSDAISGHHGTGGYEVWKLMKQFGGSAEFISTPDEEYTVTYKLTFQISNIYTSSCGNTYYGLRTTTVL